MQAKDKAEVVRQLEEAFDRLMSAGTDHLKMAYEIGHAQYLIASALVQLGQLGPMSRLNLRSKQLLSNSAAPIGSRAAKESAPAVSAPLSGERGVSLPAEFSAGSASDQQKSAQS